MKEESIKYPGFRWFVAITYVVVIISSALSLISIAPLLGDVAKTIGQDIGVTAGLVMSTFNLFVAFGAIAGGVIIDKFGVIRTWFGALTLLIIGSLLTPFLGNTGTGMTIIRVIQGAGTGPIMGCCAALAAQWFPKNERGILTGMQGLSMGAGVAIGTIIGPLLAHATGDWKIGLACEAGISLVALIMVIVVAIGPKPPVVEDISPNNTSHDLAKTAIDFKTAMFQPATLGTLAVCFALSWVFQAMGDLTPSYLAIDPPVGLGKGNLLAGSIYSTFSIAFMVGAVASGFVTTKLFKGKSRNTIIIGFIVSAITIYGLNVSAIFSEQGTLIFDLIICGLFMSMVQPPAYAFIATCYPEHVTGKVGGTIVGLSIFGGVGGATAGAYFLHATGHYFMGVNIMVLVSLLGIIGAIFIKTPKIYQSINENSAENIQQ